MPKSFFALKSFNLTSQRGLKGLCTHRMAYYASFAVLASVQQVEKRITIYS